RSRALAAVPRSLLRGGDQARGRVRGLASGADADGRKPFGRQGLLARMQARLRRTGGKSEVTASYRDAFVEIDYPQRRVVVGERDVQLTPLEFKLLSAFVQHPNQVLSRDQLLDPLWGPP